MKVEEIPRWVIIGTWILVITLIVLLAWIIIFINKEVETLKLMGDACAVCREQTGINNINYLSNLSNITITPN